jgi:sterol desaturase/sphingolipid hydroxylase (fatty acid hydroxylase superfamily)
MMDLVQGQFDHIRLVFFIAVFILMAVAEYVIPKRKGSLPKSRRWANNAILTSLSTLSAKYILPFTSVSVAVFASEANLGLFNLIQVNSFVCAVLCILIFDLAIYWQHRIFHMIPVLWNVHRVHHADKDYDVTTGARFHPIEIILSMMIKGVVILALGAPAEIVVIFEIILNALAMFNHSNIHINSKIDTFVRKLIVTPDFHRIHHSTKPDEHHKNYGFNLAIWDYLFKSYKGQASEKQTEMKIGLSNVSDDFRSVSWYGMLLSPFVRGK